MRERLSHLRFWPKQKRLRIVQFQKAVGNGDVGPELPIRIGPQEVHAGHFAVEPDIRASDSSLAAAATKRHEQPRSRDLETSDLVMRILYLAHRVPYPPNKGDKILSFHEIRHLGRLHELHLLAFCDRREDLQY